MADQEISCPDCKNVFIHDERSQEFYAQNGFSPPKRCKPCRDARKAQRHARENGGQDMGWDANSARRHRG